MAPSCLSRLRVSEAPPLPDVPSRGLQKTSTKNILIVLLKLQAGEPDDPIVCHSLRVPLNSKVPYDTLSYCWGELTFDSNITQDGAPKAITKSLLVALRQLRRRDRVRTVWIDQLCIDQTNAEEKSRQVSIMQDIYRRSAQGIIWLGDLPTAQDGPGFTVEDVGATFKMLKMLHPSSDGDRHLEGRQGQQIDQDTGNRYGQVILAMMGSSHAKWKGVRWWQRIWTVQEAKLPPSSILQWGPFSISFDILKRSALEMTQNDDFCHRFLEVFQMPVHLLNQFCTPLANLEIHDVTGTLGVLYRWRIREATEPRDKVFALMGLFDEPPFPSIPFCDYNLSVVDVYKLVTLDLIRKNRGLLPLVGRRGEVRTTPGLPTWALDWVEPKNVIDRTHDYYANCRRWEYFDCAAGRYDDPVVSDLNGLVLQGCKVDCIEHVVSAEIVDHRNIDEDEYDETTRRIAKRFRAFFKQWRKTKGPAILSPDKNSDEAFHRTLIGDMVMDGTGQTPDHRASKEEAALVSAQMDGRQTVVQHTLRDVVCTQAFFTTKAGYIGLGPPDLCVGDEVWVLLCGNFPHVLRPVSTYENGETGVNKRTFEHVGDAYVHGIMDGEVIRDNAEASIETVVIY